MHPPRRIVSLSPSNTEILCALGLRQRLVGVDRWSNHPPSVAQLPKVGRDLEIDIERIKALEPDLVVACLSVPGMERNLAALEAAGLPYITLEPASLPSIYENIRRAGRATGREDQAERLVRSLQTRLAAVAERAANRPRRRVYWEWWPKPYVAAGGSAWISEIIALAGGVNIFADQAVDTLRPSDAEIAAREPEVICACWCGARTLPSPAKIRQRPGWDTWPAVAQGAIWVMPEAYFARPGPRLADGAERLLAALHPDA